MPPPALPPADARRLPDEDRCPAAIRTMTSADVAAGLRLCRLSHWNQVARDWQQFLDLTPGGAAVAVDAAGDVLGTVTSIRYTAAATSAESPVADSRSPVASSRLPGGDSYLSIPDTRDPAPGCLAWIAMVLVDPARRGGGIGTALLRHGLAQAADAAAVGLDATALGRPLYEKLGFTVDTTLTRMARTRTSGAPVAPVWGDGLDLSFDSVRHATAADIAAIADLDGRATGLDRRAMLEWLLDGAPELAWVSEGPDGLAAALLGRHGHLACHLGPVIATSAAAAAAVVRACLASLPAQDVFIDVADERPGWREAVGAFGFEAQRSFARMYRGSWRPAGNPSHLFAAIGPEFG